MNGPEKINVVIVRGEKMRRYFFNPPLSGVPFENVVLKSNFNSLNYVTETDEKPPFSRMDFEHEGLEDPGQVPSIEEQIATDVVARLHDLHCAADISYAEQSMSEIDPAYNPFAEVTNP